MLRPRVLLICIVALVIACQTVPLTNRRQFVLVPESSILSMSYEQYGEFMQQSRVVAGTPEANLVKSVGGNIARAVETYFKQNHMADRLSGYAWEFNLINDTTVNAWCMPGGKVAVYTGILPYAQNEPGLAAIVGHEVAHAVARHANERLSQMLTLQLGGMALGEALASRPAQTRQLAATAFGIGAQVGVILPYSRTQETESDRLGLIFMAMAGYDPNQALTFWQRMADRKTPKPPEFLSTHPADETRIRNLRKYMPEAKRYYRPKQSASKQCR